MGQEDCCTFLENDAVKPSIKDTQIMLYKDSDSAWIFEVEQSTAKYALKYWPFVYLMCLYYAKNSGVCLLILFLTHLNFSLFH